MDAGIIHNNVRVDAGGFGAVLDCIKYIWYWPDDVVKTQIKIKDNTNVENN